MKSIFTHLLLLISFGISNAQENHFLVELEARGPELIDLVKSYEGFPAIPLLASDMNGKEQSLFKSKAESKNVILWFWNLDCPKCFDQIEALNSLSNKYQKDLQILSFVDEDRPGVSASSQFRDIQFPIIPSSKTLADGPYGGDLGYPRIFFIDEYGIIRWVFPEAAMKQDFDTFKILEILHQQLKK